MLGYQWSFREHVECLKAKAAKRMGILNKVGSTTWGLESRILAITTHSLVESVASYGLAAYGSHISQLASRKIDTGLLTRAARRTVGTGPAARREILRALAYTKPFSNHYVRKSANVFDGVLRSTGTSARLTAVKFLHEHYHLKSKDITETQNA